MRDISGIKYATFLSRLARLYQDEGRHKEAESAYYQALAAFKSISGMKPPAYAACVSNLASLYQHQGLLDKAGPLFYEALETLEASLGRDHPDTAHAQNSLAQFYYEQGDISQAEQIFGNLYETYDATLSRDNPYFALGYKTLSLIEQHKRNFSDAWTYQDHALTLRFNQMINLLNVASDKAVKDYLSNIEAGQGVGVTAMALDSPQEYHPMAFNWVLRTKALEVDILSSFQQAINLQRSSSAYKSSIAKIERATAQLNDAIRFGKDDLTQEIQEHLDQLQQDLRRKLVEKGLSTLSKNQVSYQDLQPLLRQHQALYVDVVKITPYNFRASDQDTRWEDPLYVAYVLQPQRPPVLITLGNAKELESALDDYQKVFSYGQHLRSVPVNSKTALANAEMQITTNYQEQARKVYDLLVAPLKPYLANTKRLYLSPDAAVSQVPFEALLTPEGHYLGQSLDIIYLTSGRDLLKLASNQDASSIHSARIFSGPHYNLSFGAYQQLLKQANPNRHEPPHLLAATATPPTDASRQAIRTNAINGFSFSYLKGASQEGELLFSTLSKFLPTLSKQDTFFQHDHALEDWLKASSPPDILHLATHGFSIPTHQEKNPLLRSGIALAGANTLPKSPNAPNDGILYAQEAALLNLRGTNLVVLSACETAKGEALPGKGVYNLNRAFLYAGADTVISSLHSVHDEATQKLMTLFYENLLDKKMTKLQALQAAKKTMQHDPNFSHPFFWASFILVGNPN